MYADGFGRETFVAGPANDTSPVWSADGRQLAWLRANDAFVATLVAPVPTNVSNSPEMETRIEWAPDGTRIAYESVNGSSSFIHSALLDGTDVANIGGASAGHNFDPTWSPDSNKLAFSSFATSESPEIWTANSDGTGFVQVSVTGDTKINPRWSPDGLKIAYSTNSSLEVIDLKGSLIGVSPAGVIDLVWSPDSSRVLLVTQVGGNREIAVVPLSDFEITSLTTSPGVDEHPRWSPDGAFVVFESDRDGNREIYRMNADGSDPINLTNHPRDDRSPEWASCPGP